MKQVSLIIPKNQNPEKPLLFLGVLYLASYLKDRGIPATIYDEQLGEATNNFDEITKKSSLVCFTVMTSQLEDAKKLSQKIKQVGIPVVWGGIHPLLFPKQCLRESYVDYVVYDEGEETLYKLTKNIANPKKVIGIYYKTGSGKIIRNRPRPYIDLNKVSPHWNLINLDKYYNQVYFDGDKKDTLPIHVGRGCYLKCSFCINTLLNERKHRGITAENIIREANRLLSAKRIDTITFVDENFFIDLGRIKEFCRLYKENNCRFKWIATSLVSYILRMDDDFLRKLKECGCTLIRMGIESGSQRVLNEIIHKPIKTDDIIKVIGKLKKHDISAECSFLIGMPGETIAEQNETFDLIKKLMKMYDKLHIIGPQLYRPYPGAEMYNEAKKAGFNEPKSIDEWIEWMNKFGFLDINQLTWIPNKKELMNKCKYFAWSQIEPKGLAKPMGLFFRSLFRLRMKLDYYGIPLDIFFYEKMKDIYVKAGG